MTAVFFTNQKHSASFNAGDLKQKNEHAKSGCELADRVPEVAKKLESGELSLTVVAKLASHVRREGTDQAKTEGLARELSHCTIREAEKVLVAHATLAPVVQERLTPKASEMSELKIGADAELLQLLARAKELCAETSSAEVLRAGLKELIKKKEKALGVVGQTRAERPSAPETGVHTSQSRYVPLPVRQKIAERSGGACEYVSPDTGKRCASRFALQWDHIDPLGLGGKTTATNLRQYCAAHNQLAAIQVFGRAKMERWIEKS